MDLQPVLKSLLLRTCQIMCSELFGGTFLNFYPIPSELEILECEPWIYVLHVPGDS